MKKSLLLVLLALLCFPLIAQDKEHEPKKVVYLVALEGEISESSTKAVKQQLAKIDVKKAAGVLLEIDSPGGGVFETFAICDEIDRLAREGVNVYCFVLNKALSGGALVAMACDQIYMRKTALIGDSQVKMIDPFRGMKNADEKFAAPVRKRFASYAENRQYPKALAEAMVDPDIEVREVEYRGQRYFKTPDEIQKMKNDTGFNKRDIHEVTVIVLPGKLAIFTAREASEYGFCKGIYQSRKEVLKKLELDKYPLEEIKASTTEGMVNFLTNKLVVFFLIALGILGILVEIWTPGFGIPGIIGLTCLSLFFAGGYLADVTAIWEIMLFIIGVALLALEIFVIPGFGVIGIAGVVCCFLALLLSLQAFSIPQTQGELDIFMNNLLTLTLGIGVDVVGVFMLSKFLPESAPLRRLSVSTVQKSEEGYTTALAELKPLEGKQGNAHSSLRPAGRIKIENITYDAMTQGNFIEPGEKIKVLRVQGNRIIVEKLGD